MSIEVLAVLGRGIVDPRTPVAPADDAGITRGDGCFEGLRIREAAGGARFDALDGHLARMAGSAAALAIPFDEAAWRGLLRELGSEWSGRLPASGTGPAREAAVKLVLTRGSPDGPTPLGFATVSPLPADVAIRRRDGVDVVVLSRGTTGDSFAAAPWLLGGVKTLSYAINMAAAREAARRGAHEPLFVTASGYLLEAPTASVVWIRGRTIFTVAPDGGNGILASVTVQALFERAATDQWRTAAVTRATVADLRRADVAMLVSSVAGLRPIRSIDGAPLVLAATGRAALEACTKLTGF